MATITYTRISTCTGGEHVTMDVQLNAGTAKRTTYEIDELRQSLASIPTDTIEKFAEMVLRVHVAGKTRAQLVTEFASPVVITI
jgi:hypothetical protein